jgi:hypothetical protein
LDQKREKEINFNFLLDPSRLEKDSYIKPCPSKKSTKSFFTSNVINKTTKQNKEMKSENM